MKAVDTLENSVSTAFFFFRIVLRRWCLWADEAESKNLSEIKSENLYIKSERSQFYGKEKREKYESLRTEWLQI